MMQCRHKTVAHPVLFMERRKFISIFSSTDIGAMLGMHKDFKQPEKIYLTTQKFPGIPELHLLTSPRIAGLPQIVGPAILTAAICL
jgi:hypothetical protein